MAALLPKSLQDTIDALGKLPGVGPRSAERYAYFLLKNDPGKSQSIAEALLQLHAGVSFCQKTFALVESGTAISPLYDDVKRNKQLVMVVAEPFDIIAIEKTAAFSGTYHVLGGLISPIDGVHIENLHIAELMTRITEDKVTEIILGTNASVEGESTALFIQQHLKDLPVTITRLARGLPVGVDLEYADQVTLQRALENRQSL